MTETIITIGQMMRANAMIWQSAHCAEGLRTKKLSERA
jgi:hypothetical protein